VVNIPVKMDNGVLRFLRVIVFSIVMFWVLLRVVFVFIRRLPSPTTWLWLCL
jgi:hypothetical protein